MLRRRWSRRLGLTLAILAASCGMRGEAGELTLKNGTVLKGRLIPQKGLHLKVVPGDDQAINLYPIMEVNDRGFVRTYVPYRQITKLSKDVELGKFETFTLNQKRKGASHQVLSVGTIVEEEPFDESGFGRRIVTLNSNGKLLNVIQGVTEISPDHIKVVGINYVWDYSIPTGSVPPPVLDAMLRRAGPDTPEHRLAIARFYVQAAMYFQAEEELRRLREDFPQFAQGQGTVAVASELRQLQAQQFLGELRYRQAAGQYQLVYEKARGFPVENISGTILQEVRGMIDNYEMQTAKITHVKELLGRFQAELPAERAQQVAPLRSEINEKLHFANVDRMEAFLNLSAANNLQPEEKLALAFSGWVLGNAQAVTELDTVLRLWHARFLVGEFLRTELTKDRLEILSQLLDVEGISAKQVAQMLPLLPPAIESGTAEDGTFRSLVVPSQDDQPAVTYAAQLPREYHPGRAYPLIVALRDRGQSPMDQVEWWSGTAEKPGYSHRHGYIVIAPEFADAGQRDYDYGSGAHRAVLEAIDDARKRFHVDSDRIFLAGHGLGGDAAFDIGLSHPSLFAGVVPIVGVADKYCRFYVFNAKRLPFYVINGDLDRDTVARNTRDLDRMMRNNTDVIYLEYIGHGHESFYVELPRIFEWMARHKRTRNPDEIAVKTLRATDNEFWWWEFSGIPPKLMLVDFPDDRVRVNPMSITGRISPDRTTIMLTSGAKRHVLRLSPELVDFEKRVVVRLNSGQKWNDFVKPDIGVMLEEFRLRGDRQNITWARIEF